MTNQSDLESASTLELLIELMYNGKAEIIPELTYLEPIPVRDIAGILGARHGKAPKSDFASWYAWFVSEECTSRDEEKDVLTQLKSFKDETGELLQRIRKQQAPDE